MRKFYNWLPATQTPNYPHRGIWAQCVSDIIFLPYEKIPNGDETLLASREEFWIRKKQAYEKGINRKK